MVGIDEQDRDEDPCQTNFIPAAANPHRPIQAGACSGAINKLASMTTDQMQTQRCTRPTPASPRASLTLRITTTPLDSEWLRACHVSISACRISPLLCTSTRVTCWATPQMQARQSPMHQACTCQPCGHRSQDHTHSCGQSTMGHMTCHRSIHCQCLPEMTTSHALWSFHDWRMLGVTTRQTLASTAQTRQSGIYSSRQGSQGSVPAGPRCQDTPGQCGAVT